MLCLGLMLSVSSSASDILVACGFLLVVGRSSRVIILGLSISALVFRSSPIDVRGVTYLGHRGRRTVLQNWPTAIIGFPSAVNFSTSSRVRFSLASASKPSARASNHVFRISALLGGDCGGQAGATPARPQEGMRCTALSQAVDLPQPIGSAGLNHQLSGGREMPSSIQVRPCRRRCGIAKPITGVR
jgi:hypothetical protein